jgi:pimeloyl-ACP methyl ester carboxylesterase
MAVGHAFCWCGKVLLSHPLHIRRGGAFFSNDTRASRLVRSLAYRLLFAPVLLAVISCVLVFAGTHPLSPRPTADPSTAGVYYDRVSLASEDGTALYGWFVPVVDAGRVLSHRERMLHDRRPAVVLVHDFGRSPEQMLSLVRPLHDDQLVVLAIGLRGVGVGSTGQTFGVNEALDVAAAVQMLRRNPLVDGDHIGVVGIGTGANAALLAAERDPRLAAVVAADPFATPDDAVASHIGPNYRGVRWLGTVHRWTLQVAYHVDLDDLRLCRLEQATASRPVLRIDGQTDIEGQLNPAAVDQAREFLTAALRAGNSRPVASATGS